MKDTKAMTTFQIVSDLHIEYNNDCVPDPLEFITPTSDILILAGDIGSLYKRIQLREFLIKLCVHFQVVLYVPGNHEYYTIPDVTPITMSALTDRLHAIESEISNLYILNRSSVRVGDICVAGCTLWSNPELPIPKYLVRIHNMSTEVYRDKHNGDILYLNKMINYCSDQSLKLLVITHYGPTYMILKGTKKRDKFFSLYASHLDHLLMSYNVHTWVCGHVHKNFDFITDGGTRVVGNQKGKPKDKIIDFSKKFIVEL